MGKLSSKSKIYNSLCEQDSEVLLLTPFVDEDKWSIGRIQLSLFGALLEFDVQIPNIYPLTRANSDNVSIKFINRECIGYPHVNNDGSVCFHPDKDDNIERKFKSELKGLKQWVENYFLLGIDDDHYTYLIHNHDLSSWDYLYFADNKKKIQTNEFGDFTFAQLGETYYHKLNEELKVPIRKFFRLMMGEDFESWSDQFLVNFDVKNAKSGFWYFIDGEPLELNHGNLRKGAKTWDQLSRFLSEEFLQYIYTMV